MKIITLIIALLFSLNVLSQVAYFDTAEFPGHTSHFKIVGAEYVNTYIRINVEYYDDDVWTETGIADAHFNFRVREFKPQDVEKLKIRPYYQYAKEFAQKYFEISTKKIIRDAAKGIIVNEVKLIRKNI